jgi:hypothetical protein
VGCGQIGRHHDPADAVAENGIEHRIYGALGKIVLGNELIEFDPAGKLRLADIPTSQRR